MKRRILGIWTPVPFCYKDFGSCEFDDICSYGRSELSCPPLLDEHDVPCECPIEKVYYFYSTARKRSYSVENLRCVNAVVSGSVFTSWRSVLDKRNKMGNADSGTLQRKYQASQQQRPNRVLQCDVDT